ncbi:MAG: BspA family leucine-rich repeat surface protein [Prevotella sp.]|nr:BspA family leucine-rich repeat surface protein [Prevotella sp.]
MLAAMVSGTRAMAKEAYAVYTSGNSTLAFYYDDNKSDREGDKYELNTGSNQPGWISDGKQFEKVVFAQSFSNYRPTTTYKWFYNQSELKTITNIRNLITDNVSDMGEMFHECRNLKSLDVNSFNTSNVTSMSYMFYHCDSLKTLDVSGWDTSNVTNMNYMFYYCKSLTELDVSGWDTGKVTNMNYMFQHCESLTSLDVSGWNTGLVRLMDHMFSNCFGLTNLDVSGWNTGRAEYMQYMFYDCYYLTNLDVSGWSTSNVKWMDHMFEGCITLTTLDVSGWDTSNVTKMNDMFHVCRSLTELDVSGWNTSKVETMSRMFYNCNALPSLNLIGWDTSKVEDISEMFYYCIALTTLNQGGWDTSNIKNMEGTFNHCVRLNHIILTGWDTSSVTTMSKMFSNCDELETLDLGGWDTRNVTDFSFMFQNCKNLKTIYGGAGWNMSAVTDDTDMFSSCLELCGSSGTTFDASHQGCSYAHLDGGPSNPGYLSLRSYDLWVGGNKVTSANYRSLPITSGNASYDIPNNTLTLDNAVINVTGQGDYCIANGLSAEQRVEGIDGLKIVVSGQCQLNGSEIAMMINGNTELTGNGRLTADGTTAVWIENTKMLEVGVQDFYAAAQKEVIDGLGNIAIDGTKVNSFILEPKNAGHFNTVNRLYSMTLNNCHFTDPYINGAWLYGDAHKFNYLKYQYLRYETVGYKDKVVIEPDSKPLEYRLWVGGTRVTTENKDNIGGMDSGTATFDPITHTLTLDNANIHIYGYDDGINNGLIDFNIEGMPDFKIVCNGSNTIEVEEGSGLVLDGNTTVSGMGLTIRAWDKGISLADFRSLSINLVHLNAEASYPLFCGYNTFVDVTQSNVLLEPGTSQNSPIIGARELNLYDCRYEDPGFGINPELLYYNNSEEMMYYAGGIYDSTLRIVPIGSVTAIATPSPQNENNKRPSNGWYTLDGRKLNSKPTTTGLYIHNGRKVVR